jgi:formate dehydrogenase major subunit
MDDRYRGVYGARNVVFINPADMEKMGVASGDLVDLIGTYDDGRHRACTGFRAVPYDTPHGCLAGYYPEMNELVPHQIVGDQSDTPASKSVVVRLVKQV